MVEYYAPRQRNSDKRWDYTCSNSAGTFALGYCAGYRKWAAEDFTHSFDSTFARKEAERLNAKYGPFEPYFHTSGHATREEANRCYWRYRLDHELQFSSDETDDVRHRCQVCSEWTGHAAWFSGSFNRFWHVCKAHQTREAIAGLLGHVDPKQNPAEYAQDEEAGPESDQ